MSKNFFNLPGAFASCGLSLLASCAVSGPAVKADFSSVGTQSPVACATAGHGARFSVATSLGTAYVDVISNFPGLGETAQIVFQNQNTTVAKMAVQLPAYKTEDKDVQTFDPEITPDDIAAVGFPVAKRALGAWEFCF